MSEIVHSDDQPALPLAPIPAHPLTVRHGKLSRAWDTLCKHCPKRFGAYRLESDESLLDPLARYHWNMALAEALTPVLSGSEIQLRNVVNDAVKQSTGSEFWFKDFRLLSLRSEELEYVQKTEWDLNNKRAAGFHPSADDYVSELSFKFWTGLLDPYYANSIWNAGLSKRFRNLETSGKSQTHVRRTYNRIRELRNRAYHHEPIWSLGELPEVYSLALESIGWISPTAHKLISEFDRFPEVLASGFDLAKHKVERALDLPALIDTPL